MKFDATSHNNHSKLTWHNDFKDTLNHTTFSVLTQHKTSTLRHLDLLKFCWNEEIVLPTISLWSWLPHTSGQSVLAKKHHWWYLVGSITLNIRYEKLQVPWNAHGSNWGSRVKMYGCPLHNCVASNPCSIYLFWVHKWACSYDQGEASHIHTDTI